MQLQHVVVAEGLVADVALVRFLACKAKARSKPIFKRPLKVKLTGVGPHVDLELLAARKSLPADLALVRFLACE